MRSKVAANAKKRPRSSIPPEVQESVEKVKKVSLGWAKLIARIYEVNPLLCNCGKEMKIIAFVTHSAEIRRILSGIGWPTKIPEFDSPYNLPDWDICQLVPGTEDGFPEGRQDPPFIDSCTDTPHEDDYSDPPHWDDDSDPPHWED